MAVLAQILRGDLKLDGCARIVQSGEQRRRWFANLEVDWAVLDLHDNVVVELTIQMLKKFELRIRSIRRPVRVADVIVINKRTHHQYASERFQGSSKHVGAVCKSPIVS